MTQPYKPGRGTSTLGKADALRPLAKTTFDITVVIPTCQRPHLLSEALDSVLQQILLPDYIVVVNDDADDATKAVVDQQKERTNIEIKYKALQGWHGPSASRNIGISICQTKWIAFLDDDDIWSPTHLTTIESFRHTSDLILASFYDDRKPHADGIVPNLAWPRAKLLYQRGLGIIGSGIAARTSSLRVVEGFDEDLYVREDRDLIYRLLRRGYRSAVTQAPTVQWRSHQDTRLSDPFHPTRVQHIRTAFEKHNRLMPWRKRLRERGYIAALEHSTVAATRGERLRSAMLVVLSGSKRNYRLLQKGRAALVRT